MDIRSKLFLLLSALLIAVTALSPGAAGAQPQADKTLFIAAEEPRAEVERISEAAASRQRWVRVNFLELESAQVGDQLILNLFDDTIWNATITDFSSQSNSNQWVGEIDGPPQGQLFLVESEGQIAADISTLSGLYQIRFAGRDLYSITQVDTASYPPEVEPIEVDAAQLAAVSSSDKPAISAVDDGSTIDVLVLYTAGARAAQGGTTQILNLINLAVLETNQSYANSGVIQRIHLVTAVETAYTETGDFSLDLNRLRAQDAWLEEAHSLRNMFQADLVTLITNSTQYCGMSYQMENPSPAFSNWAFSIVARTCAAGYYSFGHELGHNMGARHDWFVDASTLPHTYSHGYVSLAGRWRTIMSYDRDCTQRGFTCTRLPYWSNPALQRGGLPMGVYAGTNINCIPGNLSHPDCDADDHRTLNETAYTVSNFRVRSTLPFWEYPYQVFLPRVMR